MKVPNRVLDITTRLANGKETTPDERKFVLEWAAAGVAKRSALAAGPKSNLEE
jgi:hypothetical protein